MLVFLVATSGDPNLDAIKPVIDLINTWITIAQALVGSIGALAFVLAFLWKMTSVDSRSITQAKQWIQRIVVGTIGVEMASSLVKILAACGETDPARLGQWTAALGRARRLPGRRVSGAAGKHMASGDAPYRGLASFGPQDAPW